jgi:hypothetical protein
VEPEECLLLGRSKINFIRDKPIFSSARRLHEDYDRTGSVEKKISDCESQGDWRQDELIGGKPLVVK